jgi:hypothetical protein
MKVNMLKCFPDDRKHLYPDGFIMHLFINLFIFLKKLDNNVTVGKGTSVILLVHEVDVIVYLLFNRVRVDLLGVGLLLLLVVYNLLL